MLERQTFFVHCTKGETEDQNVEGICHRSQSCWVFAVFKQTRENEKSALRLIEKDPSYRLFNKTNQVQKLSSQQPRLSQFSVKKKQTRRRQLKELTLELRCRAAAEFHGDSTKTYSKNKVRAQSNQFRADCFQLC